MSNNISATQLAEYNMNSDVDFAEDYIESLDCVTVFRDEIKKNLPAAGFSGDMDNTDDIIKFVCECCTQALPDDFDDPTDKSRTVKFNEDTISKWLRADDVPVNNAISREIMYKLCFALGMDEIAAQNFFYKGCLERPFNYKSIQESVYYFCLKHKKSYSEAKAMIEKIESSSKIENLDADNNTSVIADKVRNIQNEEKLIAYLIENRSGFVQHNNRAYNLIEEKLLPKCKDLATKELERIAVYRSETKIEQVDNIDKLLNVIYGYDARATFGKEKIFKYSISHKAASKFPRLIKENFPLREQFQQIAKRKASNSVVRKALIILKFYEFFTDVYLKDPKYENHNPDILEEFVDEMNAELEKCGYVQLYWRNPFDWMIGYCAQEAADEGGKPVDCLRNLIETFYLSNLE